MSDEKVYCREQVWPTKGWHPYRCTKTATKDGWCALHHPDAKKKREEASKILWEAKSLKAKTDTQARAVGRKVIDILIPPVSADMSSTEILRRYNKLIRGEYK